MPCYILKIACLFIFRDEPLTCRPLTVGYINPSWKKNKKHFCELVICQVFRSIGIFFVLELKRRILNFVPGAKVNFLHCLNTFLYVSFIFFSMSLFFFIYRYFELATVFLRMMMMMAPFFLNFFFFFNREYMCLFLLGHHRRICREGHIIDCFYQWKINV